VTAAAITNPQRGIEIINGPKPRTHAKLTAITASFVWVVYMKTTVMRTQPLIHLVIPSSLISAETYRAPLLLMELLRLVTPQLPLASRLLREISLMWDVLPMIPSLFLPLILLKMELPYLLKLFSPTQMETIVIVASLTKPLSHSLAMILAMMISISPTPTSTQPLAKQVLKLLLVMLAQELANGEDTEVTGLPS